MIVHCSHDALVSINELKPHPDNNNRHSIEQLERLARIIEFNGVTSPITVSKRSGLITRGHARLEAAKLLGYKKFPVQYIDYRDEAHEYSDLTADNEIARWAELDRQAVYDKIATFEDFDIDLLGMQEFSIDPVELDDINDKKEELPKMTLQVQFTNELDCQDLFDDLTSKGYAVKKL